MSDGVPVASEFASRLPGVGRWSLNFVSLTCPFARGRAMSPVASADREAVPSKAVGARS